MRVWSCMYTAVGLTFGSLLYQSENQRNIHRPCLIRWGGKNGLETDIYYSREWQIFTCSSYIIRTWRQFTDGNGKIFTVFFHFIGDLTLKRWKRCSNYSSFLLSFGEWPIWQGIIEMLWCLIFNVCIIIINYY